MSAIVRRPTLAPLLVAALLASAAPVGAQARAAAPAAVSPAQDPRVAEVRLHGNHSTLDAEILALAGIEEGDPADPAALAIVRQRLLASGRFDAVDVATRYLSLSASDRVVVLIEVVEGTSLRSRVLFLPVLAGSEEEGFVYGVRVSARDAFGGGEFVSVPLTWGGVRRAAFEIQRDFGRTRVGGTLQIREWENPHFDLDERRIGGGLRVEQRLGSTVRARLHGERYSVRFGALDQDLTRFAAGVELDTRPDRIFPWSGVVLAAQWQRIEPGADGGANRVRVEGQLYRRLLGRPVLMLRGVWSHADAALPAYERPLLGGIDSLRGYRAGRFADDRLAHTRVEVRLPMSSPTRLLQWGLVGFWDMGAAWPADTSIHRVRFRHGAGGGLFAASPLGRLDLSLGFDLDGSSRLHVGAGIRF